MKQCFKCGRLLPLDEFYRHPQTADGHLGKCKACARADTKANYRDDPVKHAAYERLREQTPERKAWKLEEQRKTRAASPGKYRARQAVSNALRSGKLVRQPCEKCHAPRAEAHHDDYRKPLAVHWLCRRCHLAEHGKNTIQRAHL